MRKKGNMDFPLLQGRKGSFFLNKLGFNLLYLFYLFGRSPKVCRGDAVSLESEQKRWFDAMLSSDIEKEKHLSRHMSFSKGRTWKSGASFTQEKASLITGNHVK